MPPTNETVARARAEGGPGVKGEERARVICPLRTMCLVMRIPRNEHEDRVELETWFRIRGSPHRRANAVGKILADNAQLSFACSPKLALYKTDL